jgi:dihydrolipoamide dehydrogenase
LNTFDVVVLGAGPGGQIAATRAAQLGFRVACVDDWVGPDGGPAPGGTCTNVGCIPAKALLQSTEYFELATKHLAAHGLEIPSVGVNVEKMQARKNNVVRRNGSGILYLFKKNNITFLHGRGSFAKAIDGGYEIAIAGPDVQTIATTHVIIATGSAPRPLASIDFDEDRILSNEGASNLMSVPKSLGIVGCGVIGLELGSVWRRLGAEVTLVETTDTFLPSVDEQIAKEARKAFDKQGLKIELGAKLQSAHASANDVTFAYVSSSGEERSMSVERVIVSIGRIPNTDGLGADAVGLELDDKGRVEVDDDCRTNLSGVWGIGDVVRGPMLAHKAEEEGSAVAERIAGQRPEVDFNTVPWVVYTEPEIAWVGKTEQELRRSGRPYKAGTFPFLASGRARAMGDTTGMVKVIADAATDEVLGVHIVGPRASELIAEAVVVMEFRGASEDIARICHPHPTLSEAMKEASLAVHGRALNF